MEKQQINSLKSIHQKHIISQGHSNDRKFKKVNQDIQEFDDYLNQSMVYKAAVHGCQKINQKMMQIRQIGLKVDEYDEKKHTKGLDFEQPKRPQIKVSSHLQRVHSLSMHRSQSEHKTFKNRGRNYSAGRSKVYTATRFSNQLIDSKNTIQSFNPQKQLSSSLHRKTYSSDFKESGQVQEKSMKKSVKKRVRLKTNSVISLSGDLINEKKYSQCIPLEGFQNKEEEESFWENAYRIRKGQIPAWYQMTNLLGKDDKQKKNQVKQNQNTKQHKKVIFEGYDFDGELIPSLNTSTKHKKPIDDLQNIQVQFIEQNEVENLQNYHQRQQRYARTVKKIKFNPTDYKVQESDFLNIFEKLEWNKKIDIIKQDTIDQVKTSQKSIKLPQSKRFRNTSLHQSSLTQQDKKSQVGKNSKSDKIKDDHEKLLQQFEKVKFNRPEQQVNQSQNFPFGFSKYVKVKKFQQKQKKSKSYNYHTVNFFPTPKDSQTQIQSKLKIKTQQVKGIEKVRANKRLFKQVFNMSLNYIEPENRQDVVTIKLIKNQQKQNAQDSEKDKKPRMRTLCPRNSDTLLLKKGFCLKPTIFKPTKQDKSLKSSKRTQEQGERTISHHRTPSEVNLQGLKKQNSIIQSSQNRYSLADDNSLRSKSTKGQDQTKIITPSLSSINNHHLQKLFKKQTKKTLIKHSANENKRQSFV